MAINKAIIQIRRGLKDDLQFDKLLPGELAIATDAPCMWFCWSPGNVEQLPTSDNVIDVIIETVNQYLANNDITVISDGFMRVYDGWIQYSADNKTWKNVIAVSELIGENGGYYTPEVTDNGDLTWTPSSAGMEPLPSVNIRGPEAELTKESVENALGYAPLKSADVVDNLLGNSGKLPLSDKQGKVLDEKISELNTNRIYYLKANFNVILEAGWNFILLTENVDTIVADSGGTTFVGALMANGGYGDQWFCNFSRYNGQLWMQAYNKYSTSLESVIAVTILSI